MGQYLMEGMGGPIIDGGREGPILDKGKERNDLHLIGGEEKKTNT